MDDKQTEKLFKAITADDAASFAECAETMPCGTIRFGRFPVLSLLYLYGAKKLISEYEERFLKCNSWKEIKEPASAAAEFRKKAGKCLRLYLDEVVSPAEMLLILDKTSKLKKIYPTIRPTTAVKQRLKDIYGIKYSLNVEYSGNEIILDRRPMTKSERKKLLISVISAVLCVAIAVGTPFVVNAFSPFIGVKKEYEQEDEQRPLTTNDKGEYEISDVSDINFSSNKAYSITEDLTIDEDFYCEDVNCRINGNGNTVVFSGSEAIFGKVTGSISNVVFETTGEKPLIKTVQLNGVVEDITLNVRANAAVSEDIGFLVNNNYGTVKNVTVNISGTLNAGIPEWDGKDQPRLTVGGVVLNNATSRNDSTYQDYYGITTGCTVNFDGFILKGTLGVDAVFGGVVGKNAAQLSSCKTTGNIFSDTFDVSGICAYNDYYVFDCENAASISEVTDSENWNPLVAGIVLFNTLNIHNCVNRGNLSSVSACEKVEAADGRNSATVAVGIAYESKVYSDVWGVSYAPDIKGCKNYGTVSAVSSDGIVFLAGINHYSEGIVDSCENYGDIYGEAAKELYAGGINAQTSGGMVVSSVNSGKMDIKITEGNAYVGGISSYVFVASTTAVTKNINRGNITVEAAKGSAYVGGITALSCCNHSYCLSEGNIKVNAAACCVGGILGFSDPRIQNLLLQTYVFCGAVENCIVDCEIDVSVVDEDSYIAGFIGFLDLYTAKTGQLFTGYVANSYFTGKLSGEKGYRGCLVGAIDKDAATMKYFQANYAADTVEEIAIRSFYTVTLETIPSENEGEEPQVKRELNFGEGTDEGVTKATSEIIVSTENYLKIQKELGLLSENENGIDKGDTV